MKNLVLDGKVKFGCSVVAQFSSSGHKVIFVVLNNEVLDVIY